jgi:hypothetical protein
MKPWQTKTLVLVTIVSQVLSCVWGSQPVFFSHCGSHEHESDSDCDPVEPGCDPSSCLALFDHAHEHDGLGAGPANGHRCHCHHFHFRAEAPRVERVRTADVVRKAERAPVVLLAAEPAACSGTARDLAASTDAAAAAPLPQGVLALRSIRLLV